MMRMDPYVHLLGPGGTATVMATGRLKATHGSGVGDGFAAVVLPGGGHVEVQLPERPGVRLIAGDLTPTLLDALEDAIEHLGKGDPEWVAPETLDRLDRYERALDALRGWYADEQKTAGHCG
jgi:hypothetical protein